MAKGFFIVLVFLAVLINLIAFFAEKVQKKKFDKLIKDKKE